MATQGNCGSPKNPDNMFCRNCGKEIAENAVVCIHCGVKAGDGNKFCSNCGAQPDPLACICIKCSNPLKSSNSKEVISSFRDAIDSCFKKYTTFTGRANRSEYWFFYLFIILLLFLSSFNEALQEILFKILFKGHYESTESLIFLPMLATYLPSLAVQVRRLHDIGKSGWWISIGFIPLIGWIWMIVLMCLPSQEGDNKYGVNPN